MILPVSASYISCYVVIICFCYCITNFFFKYNFLSLIATHDPGWNDPPLFSFDAVNTTVQSKTTKKTLLNKRVAFPLTSHESSKSAPICTMIPQTLPNNSVPPATLTNISPASGDINKSVTKVCDASSGTEQKLLKEEALQKVMGVFNEILAGASEELQVCYYL